MTTLDELKELRSERAKLVEEMKTSPGVVQSDRGYIDARYARAVAIQQLDQRINEVRREIIKEV